MYSLNRSTHADNNDSQSDVSDDEDHIQEDQHRPLITKKEQKLKINDLLQNLEIEDEIDMEIVKWLRRKVQKIELEERQNAQQTKIFSYFTQNKTQ